MRRPNLVVLLVALSACGGSQTLSATRDSDVRSLTEVRALQVIREAAADSSVRVGAGFAAELTEGELDVDYRIEGGSFGVEWVSAQDRVSTPSLPEPPPAGQLRIVADQSGAQILILDAASYRYDPRRDRVQAGASGAADVEARLRRDMRDFLVYAGLTEG